MPRGKKKTTQDTGEKIVTAVENAVTAIVACGHINRQHHNDDNILEDLACTLDKGHAGDHANGKARWSDAAGTPARKHA